MDNHKFVHAYFSNNDRTVVEAVWQNNDGKKVISHIDAIRTKSYAWKQLLKHITIDQLHQNTYQRIRTMDEQFKEQVFQIGRERGLLLDIDDIQTDGYKVVTKVLFNKFDPETDKEKLFLYKLQLFEVPEIRDSKKKTLKTKLRQAPTLLEATKIAIQIFNE